MLLLYSDGPYPVIHFMSRLMFARHNFINFNTRRATPAEVLHTRTLGPYKYLLRFRMAQFSPQQHKEVLACINSFNFSGHAALSGDISKYYYKSFVGRDFKTLAQLAHCVSTIVNT